MKKLFLVLVLFLLWGICAVPTRAQNPNYVGFFDVGDCNVIAGWAADKNRPNTAINVSIYDGSTLLTTVLANGSRGDSAAIGAAVGSGDNGLHAFGIPFPTALKTGLPRAIGVRFESTSVELSNSPKSITCVHPRGDVGTGILQTVELVVDFKLQNGAPSVRNRLVGLNFSVRQRTGANSHDVTDEVTHYRERESPDLGDADLSAQSWTPLPGHGLIDALALRNGAGQRYGTRKIMFQVKTATLTSAVVSDTIVLEPVLKEYKVSADGGGHPLIKYAAEQGFTFPLSYYETCQGDCAAATNSVGSNLSSGSATVTVQALSSTSSGGGNTLTCVLSIAAIVVTIGIATPLVASNCQPATAASPAGTCITKADYFLFEGRTVNNFWRIKSVEVPGSFVRSHGINKFLVKYIVEKKDATCLGPQQISIGDVVVEGPEEDDFVDTANPWKNAFVRPNLRLLIGPTNPRPN